jgi:hypothetical protein
MGTEYHNRTFEGRRLSWDVARLRALTAGLEPAQVPIASIFEFDEVYWFDTDFRPTCRAVMEHAQRIEAADLADPILLAPDGYLIDGMHRVAKAVLCGLDVIPAVRLLEYPLADRER